MPGLCLDSATISTIMNTQPLIITSCDHFFFYIYDPHKKDFFTILKEQKKKIYIKTGMTRVKLQPPTSILNCFLQSSQAFIYFLLNAEMLSRGITEPACKARKTNNIFTNLDFLLGFLQQNIPLVDTCVNAIVV